MDGLQDAGILVPVRLALETPFRKGSAPRSTAPEQYPRVLMDPRVVMDPTSSRVELRFPGSADFLRLARLATADAASRAGLSIDEIEDARIAVSELCAMVGGAGVEITLVFTHQDGALHVEGGGGAGELEGENAEMAEALVAAVVDEYELRTEAGRLTFRILKRRR